MQYLDLDLYHVYNRGAHRERIFFIEKHYHFLLELIQKYRIIYRVDIIAFCLMPNHFHFVLRQLIGGSISRFIQTAFNAYTQSVNTELGFSGTLFQGSAKAVVVKNDAQAAQLFRYIHLNPVVTKVVERPEDWEFSDYRNWIGEPSKYTLTDLTIRDQFFESGTSYREFVHEFDDAVQEQSLSKFPRLRTNLDKVHNANRRSVPGEPFEGHDHTREPSKGHYLEHIEKEISNAREARKQGIEGRARVCARRAAGFAAAWLFRSRGETVREEDSLKLLKTIKADESVPPNVREASGRLTARVTPDFRYPFSTDPLDDALMIIDYVKGHLA